jgi:hypothetical protein
MGNRKIDLFDLPFSMQVPVKIWDFVIFAGGKFILHESNPTSRARIPTTFFRRTSSPLYPVLAGARHENVLSLCS